MSAPYDVGTVKLSLSTVGFIFSVSGYRERLVCEERKK